nr:MAG TPA: hypothetical protein [Caudoviricetes sp.]
MNNCYLAHHGVKGMKWGVRHDRRPSRLSRIRNYTGSKSSIALKEARRRDINTMSNKELQDNITRLNLERQYRSLTQVDIGFGRRHADAVLSYDETYKRAKRTAAYAAGKAAIKGAM